MLDRLQAVLDQMAPVEGLTLSDVLDLPEPLSTTITLITRRGPLTAPELAAELDLAPGQAQRLSAMLVAKGLLHAEQREADGATVYATRFARARPRVRSSDLWRALDDL